MNHEAAARVRARLRKNDDTRCGEVRVGCERMHVYLGKVGEYSYGSMMEGSVFPSLIYRCRAPDNSGCSSDRSTSEIAMLPGMWSTTVSSGDTL